jgi:hypothetical protein
MNRDEDQDLDSVERSMGRIAAASERIATTFETYIDFVMKPKSGQVSTLRIRFGIPN